jgi:fructokinase
LPVTYLNPLSYDKFGKRFFALLTENNVLLGSPVASLLTTSLAVVSLDAQGSPTYAFYRESVADRDVLAEQLTDRLPAQLNLLHTGGLALVPDDLEKILTVIDHAKKQGATISIDANLRPLVVADQQSAYFSGVRCAIAQAHILKVSDEDLDVLGFGDADMADIAAALFEDSSLQLIALTRGSKGALLFTRHCQVEQAAPASLTVIDTVGAGDCFHAGLIAYLDRAGKLIAGQNSEELAKLDAPFLQKAVKHAIASASLNVMRAGCNPATWAETADFAASL